ncbi:hypothetical protein OU995_12265 [Roseateles sp. SL47]|jgi:hypothetical protein|uniref:hypothetical protein n=1 Tax=Roseateles sp. SL47 TaxID=2995138 RepID=UPI00226E03B5|nr:hypothetical protein [Roseateles sp. SL47]WAC75421.1 hypothetical protein OU995_12265 [Roseateles sp. SL47]
MRRYEVILDRVPVPYHERDLARTIATQVLDARLGGPQGVVDAFTTCLAITGGDARWVIPASASRADCAAVKRWRRATEAALDAISQAFAQVFVGMSEDDLALARADEHLSIRPLQDSPPAPSHLLAEARVGLPWAATAAVLMTAVSNAAAMAHAGAMAR